MTLSRQSVRALYHGTDRNARRFRYALLAFDIASVVFFVASSMARQQAWIYWVDAVIAFCT